MVSAAVLAMWLASREPSFENFIVCLAASALAFCSSQKNPFDNAGTKPAFWQAQVREQEGGGVCMQSALLMQQPPEASPFRTLSAAGAFA